MLLNRRSMGLACAALLAVAVVLVTSRGAPVGLSHAVALVILWFAARMWTAGDAPAHRPPAFVVMLIAQAALSCVVLLLTPVIGSRPAVGAALVAVVVAVAARRLRPGASRDTADDGDTLPLLSLAAAMVLVAIGEWCDIPRLGMLASDPDVHALHAAAVIREGGVVVTHGAWGERSLDYPALFSLWNASWATLSLQDVRNTVAMQPYLQWVLGVLALAEVALAHRRARARTDDAQGGGDFVIVALLLLTVALPWGLQAERFHQEGTARLASVGLQCGQAAWVLWWPLARVERQRFSWGGVAVGAVLLGALVDLNPANAVGGGLMVLVWGAVRFQERGWRAGFEILLIVCAAVVVCCADPYYLGRLLGAPARANIVVDTDAVQPIVVDLGVAGAARARFFSLESLGRIFDLSPDLLNVPASVLVLVAALGARTRRTGPARHALLAFAVGGGATVVVWVALEPWLFALSGAQGGPYMLHGYVQSQLDQSLTCWLVALVVFLLAAAPARWRTGAVAVALTFAGGLLIWNPDHTPRVRREIQGSLGSVTLNDERLARRLEDRFDAYVSAGGSLDPRSVPKILVPNLKGKFGPERWVMPWGGTRALIGKKTFPLAFMYFLGSEDYTYQSYMEHVCERLDVAWLRERNIRYVFFGEDQERLCVADHPALHDATVLDAEGGAVFLELN